MPPEKTKAKIFDVLQIKEGSELIFTKNKEKKCTVISGTEVSYQGKNYTLAALTTKLMEEEGYAPTAYPSLRFFTYQDKTLYEIYQNYASQHW